MKSFKICPIGEDFVLFNLQIDSEGENASALYSRAKEHLQADYKFQLLHGGAPLENSASLDAIPDNTKLFLLREKKPEPKLVALPSMRSFKVYTPKGEVKEESELLAEGFMIDGGKDGKKFKKKFFYMLSKDSLVRCKSDSEEDRNKPEGVIWAMHFVEAISTSTSKSQAFSFCIKTSRGDNWHFAPLEEGGEARAVKKKWLHALRMSVSNPQNLPRVVFDGHLYKKSGMRNVWKKKYFALFSDRRFISLKRETDSIKARRFDFSLSDRSLVKADDVPEKGALAPTSFTFSVTSFPGSTSKIFLSGLDSASRLEWMQAIRSQINFFVEQEKQVAKKAMIHEKTRLLKETARYKEQIDHERERLQLEKQRLQEHMDREKKQLHEERAKARADFEAELTEMRAQLLQLEQAKEEEKEQTAKKLEQEKAELIAAKEKEVKRLEEERVKAQEEAKKKVAKLQEERRLELEAQRKQLEEEMSKKDNSVDGDAAAKLKEMETQQKDEMAKLKRELAAKAKADKEELKKQVAALQSEKQEMEQLSRGADQLDVVQGRGRKIDFDLSLQAGAAAGDGDAAGLHALLSQLLVEMPSGQYAPEAADSSEEEYDDYEMELCRDGPAHVADLARALQSNSHFAAQLQKALSEQMLTGKAGEGEGGRGKGAALISSEARVFRVGTQQQALLGSGKRFNLSLHTDLHLPRLSPFLQRLPVHQLSFHTTVHLGPQAGEEGPFADSDSDDDEGRGTMGGGGYGSSDDEKEEVNAKAAAAAEAPLKCCLSSYSSLGKVGYDAFKSKHNQDRALVQLNYGERYGKALFGVFDGHGTLGHDVSQFCIATLPMMLAAERLGLGDDPNNGIVDRHRGDSCKAFAAALARCDAQLKKKMDCTTSGTTAVIVLVDGDTLHTANVGDSRAVLGLCQAEGGAYTAEALSEDQNPDSPVEQARIEAAGGRVQRPRDYEGEEYGTPRVWLKDIDMPGLAMGRSLGDTLAHSVGVTHEPVVTTRKLDKACKFMVVCSDGVWEFMQSQEVVDIVAKAPNADAACQAVVSQATELWNENEAMNTDDITCVVVYFDTEDL